MTVIDFQDKVIIIQYVFVAIGRNIWNPGFVAIPNILTFRIIHSETFSGQGHDYSICWLCHRWCSFKVLIRYLILKSIFRSKIFFSLLITLNLALTLDTKQSKMRFSHRLAPSSLTLVIDRKTGNHFSNYSNREINFTVTAHTNIQVIYRKLVWCAHIRPSIVY